MSHTEGHGLKAAVDGNFRLCILQKESENQQPLNFKAWPGAIVRHKRNHGEKVLELQTFIGDNASV